MSAEEKGGTPALVEMGGLAEEASAFSIEEVATAETGAREEMEATAATEVLSFLNT